jgi:hypothetical protein
MVNITLTNNNFNSEGYWYNPLPQIPFLLKPVDLFDQNGYELTTLEQHYSSYNKPSKNHRYHSAIKDDWFVQDYATTGAVLNHSLLFERKAFTGAAKEQLEQLAASNNLIYKLLAMRPKWGLDFSMDWVDSSGNAFEVLHWEYDSFDYEEIQSKKIMVENKFLSIDWEDAGKQILNRKKEWHHLDFFSQSDWKCDYFNIIPEKFKMVIWK